MNSDGTNITLAVAFTLKTIVIAGILLLTGNMQRYSLSLINYFGLNQLSI